MTREKKVSFLGRDSKEEIEMTVILSISDMRKGCQSE